MTNQILEFIKWCFRDESSSLTTIIVISVVFSGIRAIIEAFRK